MRRRKKITLGADSEAGSEVECDAASTRGICGGRRGTQKGTHHIDQLRTELLAESSECGGDSLCGEQSTRSLHVRAHRLHRFPATAKLHVLNGAGQQKISSGAAVAQRVRHVGSVAHTQALTGSAYEAAEAVAEKGKMSGLLS